MADDLFEHPRLAAVYDDLDPDRSDLDAYLQIAQELGAPRESRRAADIDGIGRLETWYEVTDITWPLVRFRGTWTFTRDGTVLTSESTLRFRERAEVQAALTAHGYTILEVRDAPDRPGREFVFLARRPVPPHAS